jgi:hypothetical protein
VVGLQGRFVNTSAGNRYGRCLVCIASVIGEWMSVEQWRNGTDRGKPKYWERKLSVSLCAFYPTWSGIELGSPRWRRTACELWIGRGDLEEIRAILFKVPSRGTEGNHEDIRCLEWNSNLGTSLDPGQKLSSLFWRLGFSPRRLCYKDLTWTYFVAKDTNVADFYFIRRCS